MTIDQAKALLAQAAAGRAGAARGRGAGVRRRGRRGERGRGGRERALRACRARRTGRRGPGQRRRSSADARRRRARERRGPRTAAAAGAAGGAAVAAAAAKAARAAHSQPRREHGSPEAGECAHDQAQGFAPPERRRSRRRRHGAGAGLRAAACRGRRAAQRQRRRRTAPPAPRTARRTAQSPRRRDRATAISQRRRASETHERPDYNERPDWSPPREAAARPHSARADLRTAVRARASAGACAAARGRGPAPQPRAERRAATPPLDGARARAGLQRQRACRDADAGAATAARARRDQHGRGRRRASQSAAAGGRSGCSAATRASLMQSRWVDRDAKAAVDRYAAAGISPELALRVYTTRLLGGDPKLVLHGGGNTSVKTPHARSRGRRGRRALRQGLGLRHGDDRARRPARGAACTRCISCCARDEVSDEDMVRVQRANLLDPMAPNPSVETLLHAFLPHKFVDHTHANAVFSLVDQAEQRRALRRGLWRRAWASCPTCMPGFGLAKAAADGVRRDPKVEGLILDKHGIFTFGESAREAYERMIEMVTLAEERLQKNRKAVFVTAQMPQQVPPPPRSRHSCAARAACKDGSSEGAWRRLILEFRTNDAILNFVNGKDVARYSQRRRHHARLHHPHQELRRCSLPAPGRGQARRLRAGRADRRGGLHRELQDLFRAPERARRRRQDDARSAAARRAGAGARPVRARAHARRMRRSPPISPRPRSNASPTPKRSAASSRSPRTTCSTSNTGRSSRPSSARPRPLPLAGQVAVDHRRRRRDRRRDGARRLPRPAPRSRCWTSICAAAKATAKAIGGAALAVHCDVTDTASVQRGLRARSSEQFGGVDIVVSNAGAAWQGRIGEVDEATLAQELRAEFLRAISASRRPR